MTFPDMLLIRIIKIQSKLCALHISAQSARSTFSHFLSDMKLSEWSNTKCKNSLGKSDEIFMVGVHVSQLDVNEQHHLVITGDITADYVSFNIRAHLELILVHIVFWSKGAEFSDYSKRFRSAPTMGMRSLFISSAFLSVYICMCVHVCVWPCLLQHTDIQSSILNVSDCYSNL